MVERGIIAIVGGRQSGKTLAMQMLAGQGVVTMDEDTQIETDASVDIPFRRLSIDPNSPDFHPSYVRVGVRIDGNERNDIQFYDIDRLEYMTTAKSSHLAASIEPYWRFAESRQQRRARERWEGKHK